ncbi:MAG: hypothetical protein ACXVFN_02190 [Solirubrobacteraceae bacterium]
MTAVCRAYDTPEEADRAVARLLAAQIPADDVRMLMGARVHDARREAAGNFGGTVAPTAPAGSFGGTAGTERGSFAGEASGRPEGVFGNADRDVVVTYADGGEQARVAGHRLLIGLLMDAGLDEHTAEADVRSLHVGRSLVLVHAGAVGADAVAATLDALTPA